MFDDPANDNRKFLRAIQKLFFIVLFYFHLYFCLFVFSSPELKAQVSFSDRLLSVSPSVKFSHFQLPLQNHWANFNQIWNKASLGGVGDSSLFK